MAMAKARVILSEELSRVAFDLQAADSALRELIAQPSVAPGHYSEVWRKRRDLQEKLRAGVLEELGVKP